MAAYVRAADREQQLLAAANRVLVRDGFAGLTLRTVAAEADVRLSTLQYIFPTRAQLLQALTNKVLQDCGFSDHRGGVRGLRVELQDLVDWFSDQVLTDPGMRELLRAEFVANINRTTPVAEDYPVGEPILERVIDPWLKRMADDGPETFGVATRDVADLLTIGFAGLTYNFLMDGDVRLYRRESRVLVAAAVALADPQPKQA